MLKIGYPICAQSFKQWYLSNEHFKKIYYSLGSPTPFDVSLRDGLQSLSISKQENFSLEKKIELYNKISGFYKPKNIEIGSIISEKVLPIFKDTIELNKYIYDYCKNYETNCNNFVLIPNQQKLLKVINYKEFTNFSFITSVSDSFQRKNTKMSLQENDKELINMMYLLDDHQCHIHPNVKLYISCINECPIEGKIDNDFIVNRILNLNKNLNPSTICLSDTCGSLTPDDFEYIVDTCNYFGIPFSKISLHLHVRKDREIDVKTIIHMALDRKIIDFDVSILETGGCSVTMEKTKLTPNLTYDMYYKCLVDYIIKLANK
uniref:Pyruvate carboxyltransferase domain-containing protein n=1 Tax=viral metagenome TaxID=1070528 RepID=A0A6C0ET54_9ZZZZ